jgi:Domain of unknown function (DUF4376)
LNVHKAQTQDDLVVGIAEGDAFGIDISPELVAAGIRNLRWDGATVLDIRDIERVFHLDELGHKRLYPAPGRVPVTCRGDARVERNAQGAWAVVDANAALLIDLRKHLADKRWRVQTGGIIVTLGGNSLTVRTDDRTRAEVAQAREDAGYGAGWSTDWKLANGAFITLDAVAISAIAVAISAHVRACFSIERTLDAQIAAGSITTTAQIDAAAWPSNG